MLFAPCWVVAGSTASPPARTSRSSGSASTLRNRQLRVQPAAKTPQQVGKRSPQGYMVLEGGGQGQCQGYLDRVWPWEASPVSFGVLNASSILCLVISAPGQRFNLNSHSPGCKQTHSTTRAFLHDPTEYVHRCPSTVSFPCRARQAKRAAAPDRQCLHPTYREIQAQQQHSSLLRRAQWAVQCSNSHGCHSYVGWRTHATEWEQKGGDDVGD
jgi:hypothetical protein